MAKKSVNVGSDQRVQVTKDKVPPAPPAPTVIPPVTEPGDPTPVAPPTITFASPTLNAVVSGNSVGLDAVPSSTAGIASVSFLNNLVSIGTATKTIFGYALTWDTTAVADGTHHLTAVATDTLGQTGFTNITVTVKNAAPPAGKVLVADTTGNTEASSVINAWIANHSSAGDVILVPQGTYWVDGTIKVYGSRTIKAQDPANPPVFHRKTLYPYRLKPDLRATVNGQPNPAYNPSGRAGGWQYDLLGGQASIPTSQGNPNQAGTNPASGTQFGGYDAKTLRSGTQIVGLQSLYGALWTQADVGSVIQYLVETGLNGSYQSVVKSVASDGKSLLFTTPTTSVDGTHEGSEGTVAWCRHQKNAGWKVEHQTNDTFSYYLGPVGQPGAHPWSGYQTALLDAVENAAQAPIFQFTDTTPCVLDGLKIQHCNDGWRNSITNFAKSYPVVTEGMRCVVTASPNQVVKNCELSYPWGAGERGPGQLINCTIHHTGMQCCIGAMPNKTVDGCVLYNSHHSLIDFESTNHIPNVTINNVTAGGPKGLLAISCPIDGLTVTNCHSTATDVSNGTVLSGATLFDTGGAAGYGGGAKGGTNHYYDSNDFDFVNHTFLPAMDLTDAAINGFTATNNKIPTSTAFVKYGNSTNVTASGNDGGSGVNSTTQKAQ